MIRFYMNSGTSYHNYVTEPTKRFAKRSLVIISILFVGLAIAYFVSFQINEVHLRETGAKSRYERISGYLYSPKSVSSAGKVKGISLDIAETRSEVGLIDYRAYVLDEYFKYYKSPLYGTGSIFVKACDKYGAPADCTTVAAIANAETDLCKYHTSAEYYNCWGFGGGGEHRIHFNGWKESIDLVTSRLVHSYGIKYMLNPSLMDTTFCGDEPGCTNWGIRVKYFMKKMSDFPKTRGMKRTLFSFR